MKIVKPLISAIIVAYRSEKYINNCIESLEKSARNAHIPIEIILVINDRKNKNYHLPKVKIIKSRINVGFARGNNIGAKVAKGDWLLFVNPDSMTNIHAIKYLSTHLDDFNVDIIAPQLLNSDNSLQFSISNPPNLFNIFIEQTYLYKLFPFIFHSPQADFSIYPYAHHVESVSGAYVLIRKDIFLKVNGFDERFFMYLEDIDYCKRVTDYGYKIVYDPNTYITHLGYRSSGGFRIATYYFKSLQEFWQKYYKEKNWGFVYIILLSGLTGRFIYWFTRYPFSSQLKQQEARFKMRYSIDGLGYLLFHR